VQHQRFAVSLWRARRGLVSAVLGAVVLLQSSATAWAHHSFAMYDSTRTLELKGTVQTFEFRNPHSLLVLAVKDQVGVRKDYTIETNGSFYLARQGWKRDSLKRGDVIVAVIHPLRDGSPGGDLMKAVLSDGHQLIARAQPTSTPAEEKKK
jgi:hypothetical protein